MTELRAVVLDTDVFSYMFIKRGLSSVRVDRWRARLAGCRVVISFQTRMELLGGALSNHWGERRMRHLNEILNRTPTIRADDDVIAAHAALIAACRAKGHALQQKCHTGDRWVAASAIAKNIELLSGDGIFKDAPGLVLMD